jgi:hypothetical protein
MVRYGYHAAAALDAYAISAATTYAAAAAAVTSATAGR